MKQQIDALVAQDDHLQAFSPGEPKSCTVTVPYKERCSSFYLAIARTLALVSGKLELDDEVNAPPGGNLRER